MQRPVALKARESRVLGEYVPILLFLVVATAVGVVLLIVGTLFGRLLNRPQSSADKVSPYECGFEAFEDARMQFDVRYYLIAILFIAFDLEIAFVFPWAVIFRSLGMTGLVEMGIFLGLLVLGYVYVWKKGALEWE
jgi:NADH-quinone oxidoreductase subunit A